MHCYLLCYSSVFKCIFQNNFYFYNRRLTSLRAMDNWINIPFSKSDLNLRVSLNGGQCFRWKENNEGEWTGVLGQRVWRIRWSEKEPDMLQVKAWGSKSSTALKKPEATQLMTKYLRLDIKLKPLYLEWSKCDSHFKSTASKSEFTGIRMLNQDPVENVFSFICSSNNNISRISSMVEKMCVYFGSKICNIDGKDYYSFPTLERLSQDDVNATLREAGFGYRAPFVQGSAFKIISLGGERWLENLTQLEYPKAKQELMTLPGIGAKVADCICLMSLGHLQAVPVDTHVYQIAVARYTPHLAGKKSLTTKVYDEITDCFLQMYGPLAGWAHTVLFCADLKVFQEKKKEEGAKPAKRRRKN